MVQVLITVTLNAQRSATRAAGGRGLRVSR